MMSTYTPIVSVWSPWLRTWMIRFFRSGWPSLRTTLLEAEIFFRLASWLPATVAVGVGVADWVGVAVTVGVAVAVTVGVAVSVGVAVRVAVPWAGGVGGATAVWVAGA